MVTLNRNLLNLPLAESGHVSAQEIFEQNRILLQVTRCHESRVHYDVISLLMVAKDAH